MRQFQWPINPIKACHKEASSSVWFTELFPVAVFSTNGILIEIVIIEMSVKSINVFLPLEPFML